MLDFELTAVNFERVQQQLDALEISLRTKVNTAGLRAIAKPLRADLAASLPVKTGALRQSIGYKKVTQSRASAIGLGGEDAVYEVGSTKKSLDSSGKSRYQTYKLRFLSYGTLPHRIKAKAGGTLKFGGGFSEAVDHPGIQGGNYVKKVYDKHQSHMQGLFVSGAQSVLAKHGVELI